VGINRNGAWDVTNFRIEYVKSRQEAQADQPKSESTKQEKPAIRDPKALVDEKARRNAVPAGQATGNRQKDPAAWRLVEDGDYLYSYAGNKITLRSKKDGSEVSGDYASARGVQSTAGGDTKRDLVYYRAPGKRYDGRLRRIVENGRTVAEYRYNRKTGVLEEIVDQNGESTFLEYPAQSSPRWEPKPIRIRRGTRKANRIIAEYGYDAAGRVIAVKEENGNVTRVTYTPRGEVASVRDVSGTTSYAYDAMGRVTIVTRNGVQEKVAYDRLGRIVQRTAADGSKTSFTYDARGNLLGQQRDGKSQISYTRDNLGRVVEASDPLGRSTKYEYDVRSNLLAEHAPNGSVTRYEYDAAGRRIAQIDGDGNRIQFEYDAAGHLIKQTNALGKTLTWTYGPGGRLLSRTNGVQTFTYSYDAKNRLSRINFDASAAASTPATGGNPSSPAVSFFGSPEGASNAAPPQARAAGAQASGTASQPAAAQTLDYIYDTEGRMLTATTPDTSFEYVRDNQGCVEALRMVERDREQLLRYRYDAAGRRTGLILAEFKPGIVSNGAITGSKPEYEVLQQTEYTYDSAGRLSAILDNGTEVVSYSYDGAGRLVGKAFGNGMKAAISYDAMGRLAKIEFSGGPLSTLKTLAYTWDAASQVTNRSWDGQTQRYEYDPSGQLLKVIDATSGKVLEAYTYDKAGNMLEKIIGGEKTTMTYNTANELDTRTIDGADKDASPGHPLTYRYDRAGRLLGYDGGPQNHYGWLDKLTDIAMPDGSKVAYTYWPDGQLASKKILSHAKDAEDAKEGVMKVSNADPSRPLRPSREDSSTEHFLWDGLALLRRNDTVYLIEPHPSGGVPIASHPVGVSGPVTYYLNDMLGTTLATVQDGAVEYARLTTFGQPLPQSGGTSPSLPEVTAPSAPQAPAAPPSMPAAK
jgi:YD repeat-containing protein